jgi:lysophospholipase L1-like esterase
MDTRETASRVALLAAGLLIGIVVAELLARAFDPGFQVVFRESIAFSEDPALVYELRPGARDGKHRISSAGLRDDETPRAKPAGSFRIAAIGDSLTHGSGGPRESAYPEQLEALLNARAGAAGTRFEVLNFGVPGYNIGQVVQRLRVLGLGFEPDVIVYGYALNDPQSFSIEAEALRTLRDDAARNAAADAGHLVGRWLAHSRLYQLARQWAHRRDSLAMLRAQMPNDPAYEAARSGDRTRYFRSIHSEGESAARLTRGLDDLAALALEHQLPVLVVIFPLFGSEAGAGPEALADVHQIVAVQARKRGFAVLDLLPVYAGATRAFGTGMNLDFMHPDALGHRVAATAIRSWLCTSAWLPAASLDCAGPPPADATDAKIATAVAAALAGAAPAPPPAR